MFGRALIITSALSNGGQSRVILSSSARVKQKSSRRPATAFYPRRRVSVLVSVGVVGDDGREEGG